VRQIFSNLNAVIDNNEYIPPLEKEPPLKVLLLVEPTPFNYVSGYANRFKEMLKFLHKAGDKVKVLTPDKDPNPPLEFMGYPITTNRGFEFILYNQVTLTFDFKMSTKKLIEEFKPDLIHVSSPSAIIYPAILWSKLYNIPLVMSYHTNFAAYSKKYGGFPGAAFLADIFVRNFHNQADLTLCTSAQLKKELESIGVRRVDLWRWGVDVEVFSPLFRDEDTRNRLSDGHPEAPLLVYVGRLGVEKQLHRLKKVLEANPGARLAFVGKGPQEAELKKMFEGYPVHFAGQLIGMP
jgi:sulfoquinovosyltransferase